MKQLAKVQKYAIEHLLSIGKDHDFISKELKIPKDLLNKYIEKTTKSKKEDGKELPVKSSKITSKDMMIRKTSAKGLNTVAIMTKDAAFYNDDARNKQQRVRDTAGHIHRIK